MTVNKATERVFKFEKDGMITHVLVKANGDTAFFADEIPVTKSLSHSDLKEFYEEAEKACLQEAGKLSWG